MSLQVFVLVVATTRIVEIKLPHPVSNCKPCHRYGSEWVESVSAEQENQWVVSVLEKFLELPSCVHHCTSPFRLHIIICLLIELAYSGGS